MQMGNNFLGYRDFEQIMIQLVKERGWEFEFSGEPVPVQAVFNHATYAPALLAAAQAELMARDIPCDLAFELAGEPVSLFGARVFFLPGRSTFDAQVMRIGTVSMILDSLFQDAVRQQKGVIQLDSLQYVLGDQYAQYVRQGKESEQ